MSGGGILYSFRRCPYAIRARLALAAAEIPVEVREVALKAKPPELWEASAKGTVPVLVWPSGASLTESLDILLWAVGQGPGGDPLVDALREGEAAALMADCDGPFKRHLDAVRYGAPGAGRADEWEAALAILRRWNRQLETWRPESAPGQGPGPTWLEPLGWALMPFARQFRLTDPEGFDREPGLAELQTRLAAFEASAAFARVMAPPWAFRQPWRSPRWLYHLALEEDWQAARRQGAYTRSTRGRSLQEEGFIHASWRHQLEPTWRRFYSDDPPLRLLTIDPERLRAAGIAVKKEPAPGSGEQFPHIYGPLPLDAVNLALPWEAPTP
jgi:glutathione S-transferase